jgi:ATP-dependent Clp protease, protease subunit
MNYGKEFRSFAKSEGISSLSLDYYQKQIGASLTPYILEERELRASQMDIFSRLIMDRIVWASGTVDDRMGDIVQAQLIFLDTTDKKDINLYLNTGGGSVMVGLGIRDVMNYINADVATTNLGMCASMGSILLSSGAKGKRSSLISSKVMTHFVSYSTGGNIQDTRIGHMEAEKYNFILFKILAEIYEISRRDKWFNSEESLNIGLIDEIIGINKNKAISEMLEGFDEYYEKEILNKGSV